MKTVEITRHKQVETGAKPESTFKVFMDIYRREGIAGINKGVNAVALRQATNWGSRMGFARLAEMTLRKARGLKEGDRLAASDKILASSVEVVRVEVSPLRWQCRESPDSLFRCSPQSNRSTLPARRRRPCSTLSPTSTARTVSAVFIAV
jgi:hypothetical protein